jgi:hypothetical protein
MWQKIVNNNINFEKSVIIVLNLSYYILSSVSRKCLKFKFFSNSVYTTKVNFKKNLNTKRH